MNIHNAEMQKYNSQCLETRTFSFDVFDTFILRSCTSPEGVFERAFQLSAVFSFLPNAATSYVQHRRQAETRARKAALKKTGSAEVSIEEIYSLFPLRLFGLTRAALPDLVRAEFAAELDLCRPHPGMLRQYLELRTAGARTGFISDTYWSVAQLTELLRSCHPGLCWDFLYSSSESRTNKGDKLFSVYLSEQSVAPRDAVHMGDNEKSDIEGARHYGIAARHYPQSTPALASIFNRETSVGELLCPGTAVTLDHGLRTLRRVVASQSPATSPMLDLGFNVLGPVLRAFDAFVADRVEKIDWGHGRTAVAFLGRDGFLSHRIWEQMRDRPASYIALNRRVSVMGSAATLDPLMDLLNKLSEIDAKAFSEIAKVLPTSVAGFFASCPNGIASGRELADALPDLIDAGEIAVLAAGIRTDLLRYLRRQIVNFDDCRDLVIIDLGYSGSIQKSLRSIFDIEGLNIRLHGLYLLTTDESTDDLSGEDSFEGFISDMVVTPHVKRMLLRNVALLEQMCCAATGSVRSYRDGEALYEDNPQPLDQLDLGKQVQAGAIAFAAAAAELSPACRLAPFADLNVAARSAAAILGRLLLMPTDDELQLLGSLTHDVNLGTLALAPLLDGNFASGLHVAQAFPLACTATNPPMWPAGSFSALAPVNNFLYLLFGSNRLPSDIFDDVKCGQIAVGLFGADGSSSLVEVSCYRTGFGDMRVRIPIAHRMGIQCVVVPIAKLAREGLVSGPFMHGGKDVSEALQSVDIVPLQDEHVSHAGLVRSGRYFRATQDDGALVINVPPQTVPVVIVSIGLTPLSGDRVLVR
ncbi:FMN phosphatase YigB (HAD superfamily) [Nitrobacteraceae bacterium AZCC 2161]